MTVTVTFKRDENSRVMTFIYQDDPEYKHYGDCTDFAHHEVLELLNRLGANQQDSENILEQILQQPVLRRQFQISAAQEVTVRQFFPGHW